MIKITTKHCRSILADAKKARLEEIHNLAILGYWLTIEAYINEYAETLSANSVDECSFQKSLAQILPTLASSKSSVLLRLKIFHDVLTGGVLDWGAQPWQDIKFLHELRNSIAHPLSLIHI